METNTKPSQKATTSDINKADRISAYGAISTELALLSDQRLLDILLKATPIGTSIGGTASMIEICGARVFVKKIPLTDIERRPENIMSTANLFELPLYCQYGLGGIGSPGFGAWRELAANRMCTNWVLTDECPNFPLMYHWRVLPGSPPTSDEHRNMEDSVDYWEGSSSVRARLEEKLKASAEIILFLEHIPVTLHRWFGQEIAKGASAATLASTMVESNLEAVTSFINSRNLLHLDAHFRNILTDGRRLYFADFGLATSSRFDLSETEAMFFENHRNYDRFYTQTQLVHWLVTHLYGEENCDSALHEYATGKKSIAIDPSLALIIERYAPIAIAMKNFYRKFQTDSRMTQFPRVELERLAVKLRANP